MNKCELPDAVFDFPAGGFLPAVIDYTLSQAYQPNKPMSLAGALGLLGLLAGRRYCDEFGTRPSAYIIGLSPSGCGKDYPRKVNNMIAYECGLGACMIDGIGSGAGLEDALLTETRILGQLDECDTIFRSMKLDKSGSTESLSRVLLSAFSSASSVMFRRKLTQGKGGTAARDDVPTVCQEPSLTIFATCTPSQFFDSMSARMMTNGLYARCITILNDCKRGYGQIVARAPIPRPLAEFARDVAGCVDGIDGRPVPPRMDAATIPELAVVPYDAEARQFLDGANADYTISWNDTRDEAERAMYARACEKMQKLALLFAISRDYARPVVTLDDIHRARLIIDHSNRVAMLGAARWCAENEVEASQQKIIRLIESGCDTRGPIMRRVHMVKDDLDKVLTTMLEAGIIRVTADGMRRGGVRYAVNTAELDGVVEVETI